MKAEKQSLDEGTTCVGLSMGAKVTFAFLVHFFAIAEMMRALHA